MACVPSFYTRLHRGHFVKALRFLVELLVAYEITRCLCFVARYQDIFAELELTSCIEETVSTFPSDLQIQVRSGRFYFTQASPIILDVPRCVGDGISLFASYMSHGAVFPEEIWTMVAPIVVLFDRDDYFGSALEHVSVPRIFEAIQKQGLIVSNADGMDEDYLGNMILADYEAVFLTIGRSEAYLLDIVPVTALVESALYAISEDYTSSNDGGLNPAIIKVSRRSLHTVARQLQDQLQEDLWLKILVYGPFFAATMICGFIISLIMSFDLLITSTIIYVLVRKGIVSASFRFWTVRQHFRPIIADEDNLDQDYNFSDLSDADAQAEQGLLIMEYNAAVADNMGADGVFANLSDAYFVTLAIHTATLALLVDAVFPFMIGNAVGLGAIVHMVLSLVVVRYFALPGVLMDRFTLPRLQSRRRVAARIRSQQAAASSATVENASAAAAAAAAAAYSFVPRERLIRDGWSHYRLAQGRIEETLRSPALSLNTKLATVIATMQNLRKNVLESKVHILHSWSSLNGSRDPIGGPGFVYGLSFTSGAWILLGWYDHPCSERGIKALTTYPGLVHISDKEIPDSLLPSEEEIGCLSSTLHDLKQQLHKLVDAPSQFTS